MSAGANSTINQKPEGGAIRSAKQAIGAIVVLWILVAVLPFISLCFPAVSEGWHAAFKDVLDQYAA